MQTNTSFSAPRSFFRAPQSSSISSYTFMPFGHSHKVFTFAIELAQHKMFFHECVSQRCDATQGSVVEMNTSLAVDKDHVRVSWVKVNANGQIGHIVVPLLGKPNVAWESLVHIQRDQEKKLSILWSGLTGFAVSDETTGQRIVIKNNQIYQGLLRRDLTLCNQSETLLSPKRLDASTLQWHSVAMSRISHNEKSAAQTIYAMASPYLSVGSALSVRGASSNDNDAVFIADGDISTVWTESIKGDGRGEFIVFSNVVDVPLHRLSVIVRPTQDTSHFVAPTSFWVVLDHSVFKVEMPAFIEPGQRFDIEFPQPQKTQCVAISLEKLTNTTLSNSHNRVGFAEIEAIPVLPNSIRSIDDLIAQLDDASMADLATHLLQRSGQQGVTALSKQLSRLGGRSLERAIEILDSFSCEAVSPAMVQALSAEPSRLRAWARKTLRTCASISGEIVQKIFREGSFETRKEVAELYARTNPIEAFADFIAWLPTQTSTQRQAFRTAIGYLVDTHEGRATMATWLSQQRNLQDTKTQKLLLEIAQAVTSSTYVSLNKQDVSWIQMLVDTVLQSMHAQTEFSVMYRAAESLARLSQFLSNDSAVHAWLHKLRMSPNVYIRSRVAQVACYLSSFQKDLQQMLNDLHPRVRQQAIESLLCHKTRDAIKPIATLLTQDQWSFVRIAALEFLGAMVVNNRSDVLKESIGRATSDRSAQVRMAALRMITTYRIQSQLEQVRARAFDDEELVDVRRIAIEALATFCDIESVDKLTKLAEITTSHSAQILSIQALSTLALLAPDRVQNFMSSYTDTSMPLTSIMRRMTFQKNKRCRFRIR